ncbi:hypothetical protein OV090_25535 [Nannocystis sp. RBIL2]|uniref:hypothetical protein n=1 Tax=Nannocystis sp. RBIL2 TaxID=2996788 RepID=UPI00226FE4DB|nr:hypothetical protein [Nannocystis sp. RBIL2]MCY1068131.1 hypothetical protein [Nannocystis sp. RBIL2]
MMRPADLLDHADFWRAHYSFCLSTAALHVHFGGVEQDTPLERTPFYLALFGLTKQVAALRLKEIRAAGSVDAAIQHALAADPMCAIWSEIADAIRADYRAAEVRAAEPDAALMLRFPAGWSIEVRYHPGAVKFVLAGPGRSEPLLLGADAGDGSMPMLRWEELELLTRRVQQIDDVAQKYTAGLSGRLLAIGACGSIAEDPKGAERLVAGFWGGASDAAALARELVRRPHLRWFEDAELGWLCEGGHCFRQRPVAERPGWSTRELEFVRAFFRAMEHE